jgi:predicted PurR-regulated permease PerM
MLHKFYHFLMARQVIFALFLIVIGWFLLQTRDIIVSIFIAYIIMAALMPAVKWFKGQGVPHIFAVLIPYLTVIVFLILIILPLIPFVASQIQSLVTDLPDFINEAALNVGINIDANTIQETVARESNSIGRNAVSLTTKVFGGIFATLTVMIVSFYMLYYQEGFKRSVASLFHKNDQEHVIETMNKINDKLGAWLRGQFVLCVAIGVLTYIVLTLLGVPFALPLALIAALFEVVPTLGPILSAVPAIIVALTFNPPLAIVVAAAYFIIQMLENNLLVPKIMQRAVGLNPVVVIVGVMVGASLLGIPGALLSIPFISFIMVLFKSLNEVKAK